MAKIPVLKGALNPNPMTNKNKTQKQRVVEETLEKIKTKNGQTLRMAPRSK